MKFYNLVSIAVYGFFIAGFIYAILTSETNVLLTTLVSSTCVLYLMEKIGDTI